MQKKYLIKKTGKIIWLTEYDVRVLGSKYFKELPKRRIKK